MKFLQQGERAYWLAGPSGRVCKHYPILGLPAIDFPLGRLALNAMKPNKQPCTSQHRVIILMVMMCWASQSSAQPTRAAATGLIS